MKSFGKNVLSIFSIPKPQGSEVLFAVTVFVGAFLLFQVQPLFGKYILPWFGGSPEVWTTCLLCFQVFLLAGYAYAHVSVSRLQPRRQVTLNLSLIAAALLVLFVVTRAGWKPTNSRMPVLQILFIFTVSIALPYLVLSSTGPLMQNWFTRVHSGKSPYRLYSFSNAGSLLALVSYPFVVEPALSRQAQVHMWSGGLVVFALLSAWCAAKLLKTPAAQTVDENIGEAKDDSIKLGTLLLWLALAAGASVELLAVTNKICQDIAVIPLLWIVPLSIYLLSFIICFHHERWYVRPVFLIAFILAIGAAVYGRMREDKIAALHQILIHCGLLFACCMVCHGELYRIRPAPRHLTRYYLMISLGGALGGLFVAVVAPLIFNAYHELYVGILACCLFLLLADKSPAFAGGRRKLVWTVVILVVGAFAISAQRRRGADFETAVLNTRNFFGVLTIWEEHADNPAFHRHTLQHGTTYHGSQFYDLLKSFEPTTYYGRKTGVGLAIENLPRQTDKRIGAVGLGVGTVAIYGEEGDYFRFYEINPEVKRLATTWFSYLDKSLAKVDVIMGDARLSMENEPPQGFDLLILDAFSSNVVPTHLLTKEAFEIYLRHITGDGVIAIHVSSIHLDLESVVWKLADHFKLKNVWIENSDNDEKGVFASSWILMTYNEQFLDLKQIRRASIAPDTDLEEFDLWTDDHINLLQILK